MRLPRSARAAPATWARWGARRRRSWAGPASTGRAPTRGTRLTIEGRSRSAAPMPSHGPAVPRLPRTPRPAACSASCLRARSSWRCSSTCPRRCPSPRASPSRSGPPLCWRPWRATRCGSLRPAPTASAVLRWRTEREAATPAHWRGQPDGAAALPCCSCHLRAVFGMGWNGTPCARLPFHPPDRLAAASFGRCTGPLMLRVHQHMSTRSKPPPSCHDASPLG